MQVLRDYRSLFFILLLALITLGIWLAVFAATPSNKLKVAVLDIGQGDSIYIKSPTGVEILIDAGPDNSLLRELPKVMALTDRTIDAVVETHPDADHIAGFVDLLKRYKIGAFIEPGIPKPTVTAEKLEQEVTDEKIPRYLARRGDWLDLGGGARLQILFPDFDTSTLSSTKANEGCIVAHLVYKETSMLFMCDAPMSVEDHLMKIGSSTELTSDILKVAHHGSPYSTGNSFLDVVNPNIAVISVGTKNTYGHPTKETLSRLETHNIKTLRTDWDGTVIFVSDGREFIRKK